MNTNREVEKKTTTSNLVGLDGTTIKLKDSVTYMDHSCYLF